MSLIKQALDKVQEERNREDEETPSDVVPGGAPRRDDDGPKDSIGLSLVLWSALIVFLSIVIGGQMVWLITIFLL